MSVSILEKLQQDVNPEVPFADVKSNFSSPSELVKDIPTNSFSEPTKSQLDVQSFNLTTIDEQIREVPISNNELDTELSGKINQLNAINFDSLSAEIPDSPSADNFQIEKVKVNEIRANITNLTKDLTGDLNIGNVSTVDEKPSGTEDIFNEFNQFVTNASMLPVRTLDALLKSFKKLLDKLSNPEELLQQLGTEGLTEVFTEQIQSLQAKIPTEAIKIIEENIKKRQQKISDSNSQLEQFNNLIEQLKKGQSILLKDEIENRKKEIKIIRDNVKKITNEIKTLDNSTEQAIENLGTFNIDNFKQQLENINQTNSETIVLKPLFDIINKYLDTISEKISQITDNLRNFTKNIPTVIDQGIEKVETIANQRTEVISQKIRQGEDVLTKLKNYLSEMINKIKTFIEETAAKSSELIETFKDASNQASSTVVTQIDNISGKIKDATTKLEQSIGNVNQQIDEKLNKEELQRKITEFLDQVTAILNGETVTNAIETTENAIQNITGNLENITLTPVFNTVTDKSNDLEQKLKEVDVSTLSTPSKAALKVGTTVIKQVDIAGTITPELQDAFQEILNPLENIIVLVEGQFQQINQKIESFKPSTLIEQYLTPYLEPVIDELNKYKPSILMQPVKDFYYSGLEKIEVINPNQLLEKLEQLYQKLVKVIESLSPEKITDFLNKQLGKVKENLYNLSVEKLVEKINSNLGQLDKLMGSLGLDSVLKSDFWTNLKEILEFNFSEKISEIETIKDEVSGRIGEINQSKLTEATETLKTAITGYVITAETEINIEKIKTANNSYQEATENLSTLQIIEEFTPPAEIIIDYNDLKRRFTELHNLLKSSPIKSKKLESSSSETDNREVNNVNELENLVNKNLAKLKSDESSRNQLLTIANDKLNNELISTFQQVIPHEIDNQITTPLKEILSKLDKILQNPREILGDIETVINKIAEAPGKIASILQKVTTTLSKNIRDAINTLKNLISEFTDDVNTALKQTHTTIVETVKSLNPRRLLHTFEKTDFESGKLTVMMQKIKQPSGDDLVSQYINNQLSANTQSLLGDINSDNAKNAFIKELNKLLLDDKFYRSDRFPSLILTQQGEKLKNKEKKSEDEIIFFNRLLLEAYYNQPEERIIKMNIESIFPYLQEKLKEIYPQNVVDKLDETHEKIIQLLKDIPDEIGGALDDQFQEKVIDKTRTIREGIDNIFRTLRQQLEKLKSELDIGLEDVEDAFNRLIYALPV